MTIENVKMVSHGWFKLLNYLELYQKPHVVSLSLTTTFEIEPYSLR